ncbi:SWIM zinc finger domain-containing protein [Sedimentibacter sp. B4]|uniref:SWIM zinc finger family protein n=1 Tax=Sedimentibacter sp. B4 TaxID=304766 RepID=UPI0003026D74|nr:SWIM zinc finger family protein [Sedimentibacter sp. B4]
MEKINFNLDDIKNCSANESSFKKGAAYYRENHVGKFSSERVYNQETVGFYLKYSTRVRGTGTSSYETSVSIDNEGDIADFACNCVAFKENHGACKHIAAAMMKIYYSYDLKTVSSRNVVFKENQNQSPVRNYPLEDLIKVYENKIKESVKIEQKEGTVSLTPIINITGKDEIGIEFTIGDKRQYVVKDAYELASCIKHSTLVSYGKNLEFNHELSGFEKESIPLALFLRDEADTYTQVVAKTVSAYSAYTTSGRAFKIFPYSFD